MKNINAKRTVNMVSELDKIAVSEAVVCSSPMKNKLGANTAPDIVIASMSGQSFDLT